MKTSIIKLNHKSLFTGALLAFALAQAPDTQAAVSYVNSTFLPGANLFGNPLDATMNDLDTLFPTAPEGTTVSLWNPSALQFLTPSLFTGGAWTMNLPLAPGTGAQLITPSLFINTFLGIPLNASGGPLTTAGVGIDFMPPSPFAGPDGTYLFSSKLPVMLPFNTGPDNLPANTDFDAFSLLIGRAPRAGESVTRLDAASQIYMTTTFDGVNWNNGVPGLAIGKAAFFNIGPVVPEPSTLALGLCAGILGVFVSRKRRASRSVGCGSTRVRWSLSALGSSRRKEAHFSRSSPIRPVKS